MKIPSHILGKCQFLIVTNKKLMLSKIFKIPPILDITKPIPPVFTAGQFNRNDIIKRLGKVNFPNAKPEKRKIQPMDSEAVTTRMISTEKQLEQSKRNQT